MDPEAHSVPEEPAQQVAFMFQNIRAVMAQAGGSTDDIVQIIVMLSDRRFRDLVNEQWVAMFPDPDDRPARNTQVQDLAGAMVCSALVTAVIPSDL
jgi:enamine deaminase RidA (YjgF/YER057c/UK114 family)